MFLVQFDSSDSVSEAVCMSIFSSFSSYIFSMSALSRGTSELLMSLRSPRLVEP